MAAAIRAQREAQEQAARLVETQQAAMRAAALGGMSASQYAAMSAMVVQQQQLAAMQGAMAGTNPQAMAAMAMMMNPGAAQAAGNIFRHQLGALANPLALAATQGSMPTALAALAPPPGQLAPTSPALATAAGLDPAAKEEARDERDG